MKKTDKISYLQKSSSELQKELLDLRKKLVETKAKLAMGNLKDTSQLKKIRYTISLINSQIKVSQNDTQK